MSDLSEYHAALGARLAPDGIPLDYGDMAAEFQSALTGAILLDRSHEARLRLTGRDRLELVNRMSSNDLARLEAGAGLATIFTNANARILFRAACYNRPEGLLLIGEAGQGPALANYLRRNIFFGDQVAVEDLSAGSAQFALHGPAADAVIKALDARLTELPAFGSEEITALDMKLTVARRKAVSGSHWSLICARDGAVALHGRLLELGGASGLRPAGSLTYNSLRIRSGRPAGLELSSDYIPLEVGLWDEVSFSKGCYTGQEIIARMESRERLAKTIVKLALDRYRPAPADVYADARKVGVLTSSVEAADGQCYALAVVRVNSSAAGVQLTVGPEASPARVIGYAGAQPPFISRAGGEA